MAVVLTLKCNFTIPLNLNLKTVWQDLLLLFFKQLLWVYFLALILHWAQISLINGNLQRQELIFQWTHLKLLEHHLIPLINITLTKDQEPNLNAKKMWIGIFSHRHSLYLNYNSMILKNTLLEILHLQMVMVTIEIYRVWMEESLNLEILNVRNNSSISSPSLFFTFSLIILYLNYFEKHFIIIICSLY